MAQSPVCRMDTRETPAVKAADTAAPQRTPGDICAFAISKTFLTQEIILAHTGMWCQLLLKTMSPHEIYDFFLKGPV